MVYPVAERWFYRRVIDLEGRDLHPAFFDDYTLNDILSEDNDAVRRCSIIVQPYPDIVLVCLLEVGHHSCIPSWTPHLEWNIPPWCKPPGQPQIGKSDYMI